MIEMAETQDKVTYEEAAMRFHRSTETIRKWAAQGWIKKYPGKSRLDRRMYVSIKEIEQLISGEQQAQDS